LNQIGIAAFKQIDSFLASLVQNSEVKIIEGSTDTRLYESLDQLRADVQKLQTESKHRSEIGLFVNSDSANEKINCILPEERYKQYIKSSKNIIDFAVPKVGHIEMDKEHEDCCLAFDRLQSEQTIQSLIQLVDILSLHFIHEEELLNLAGLGINSQVGLSPLTSHASDHKKIMKFAREELTRAIRNNETKISDNFAKSIFNMFKVHAEDFDSKYEKLLLQFQ